MGASGRRNRANPYADRGLDKFALVSAELEARRQELAAQLGSSLSLVRFTIGSDDSKWVPIIICPTLSKAEINALRRATTHLVTEDKPAMSLEKSHQGCTSEVAISKSQEHSSRLPEEEHDCISAHKHPSHVTFQHAGDAKVHQIRTLAGFISALERFLWLSAFSLSILADVVSNAILTKQRAKVVPMKSLPSTTESRTADSPSAAMASCPLPSISTKNMNVMTPPHSLHVKVPMTHNRWRTGGFSSAPSTPTDSRQVTNPFLASISLPKTCRLQDQAGVAKDTRPLTSGSLAKTSHSQEPNALMVPRSSISTARGAVFKKERSEKLGQALTGAGLVLGLTGLVMGYIPAIISVVCWWYALPSLRKAVGDKPFVKSHHH